MTSFVDTTHTHSPFSFKAITERVDEICLKMNNGEAVTHDEMMLKQAVGRYLREKARQTTPEF